MSKRECLHRTEKEKVELLKQWKLHPDWTINEASRELGVKEPTLRGWKRRYWQGLDTAVGSERKRRKGGGRKHKMKPYEGRVIEYLDNVGEDRECSTEDLLFYCRRIEEFTKEFSNPLSQKSWVRRTIERYTQESPRHPVLSRSRENPADAPDSDGTYGDPGSGRGDGANAADKGVAKEDKKGDTIGSDGRGGNSGVMGGAVCDNGDAVDASDQGGGSDRPGAGIFSAGEHAESKRCVTDFGVVFEMDTSVGSSTQMELAPDNTLEDNALRVTLTQFAELVKEKKISIAEMGESLDAISLRFGSAVSKRPKAYSMKSDPTCAVETGVRFVLPGMYSQQYVKCF